MATSDIVHILEALTAMCVALTALLAAAMPLVYQFGKRQPRPEEHDAMTRATTAEAAAERVKGELAAVRASQLPPAPGDTTVNVETVNVGTVPPAPADGEIP